jgi:Transposase IS116/IS110/IS902 family
VGAHPGAQPPALAPAGSTTRRSCTPSPRPARASFAPGARAVLAAAPTPALAATLTKTQIAKLLRRAGRRRGLDTEAARLQQALRDEQLRQPRLVEEAMGEQTLALLRTLDAACLSAQDLAQATQRAFNQHPDAEILASFPGLGPLTGARVLAEIGEDRSRFAEPRALKAYAGGRPRLPAPAARPQRCATAGSKISA